jgi:POT family proton-dependent oligopeptide transporter
LNALLTFFRSPWVRLALVLLAAGALGAALVVTIYLTIVDLQWLAFLGGVLFAAVLAMASQASRAEWTIARRTRQLERARGHHPDADIDGVRAVLRVLIVFALVTPFWSLFDQKASTWVLQAKAMAVPGWSWLKGPTQMQTLNHHG